MWAHFRLQRCLEGHAQGLKLGQGSFPEETPLGGTKRDEVLKPSEGMAEPSVSHRGLVCSSYGPATPGDSSLQRRRVRGGSGSSSEAS